MGSVGRRLGAVRGTLGRMAAATPALASRARRSLRDPRARAVALGALAVVALVLGLVLSDGEDGAPPAPHAAGQEQAAREPSVPPAIAELVEEMTTERKVGQLMLVGLEGTGAGDPVLNSLRQRGYGGVVLGVRNYVSPQQVEAIAGAARSAAREADHPAPWLMAPQEGGKYNAFTDLPPDKVPAEVASPKEAADLAEEAGKALRDVGMTGILAPVLDVGPVGGGAVEERAYSDVPDQVRAYAKATVEAYEKAGVFAAAKHFPGLGSASQSTELGPATVGLTLGQLARRDLIPFEAAIEAGVPGIVVGHGLYGLDDFVTPASMSETIVTGLLRDDLGFEGLAIADDVTAPAITATLRPERAAVDAVRAGVDLVYVSQDDRQQRRILETLLEAVRAGKITAGRLDEAVTRNLVAKRAAGVLELDGDRAGVGEGEVDGAKERAGDGDRAERGGDPVEPAKRQREAPADEERLPALPR